MRSYCPFILEFSHTDIAFYPIFFFVCVCFLFSWEYFVLTGKMFALCHGWVCTNSTCYDAVKPIPFGGRMLNVLVTAFRCLALVVAENRKQESNFL